MAKSPREKAIPLGKLKLPPWPLVLKIFVILGLPLLIRIIISDDARVDPVGDATMYVNMAKNFAEKSYLGIGDGPDMSRPIFYPFILGLIAKIVQAPITYWFYTVVNAVFDGLSIFLLMRIAQRVAPESWRWGALFVGLSPLWFAHVNNPITEPLSVLLFMAFLERWTLPDRNLRDDVLAGLYCGMLTLTRSMFLYFPVGLLIFEALFRKSPKGLRAEGRERFYFLGGAYAPSLWFGLRNFFSLGMFTLGQGSGTATYMAWCALKVPLLDWRNDADVNFLKNHPWGDVLVGGRVTPERYAEVMKLMNAEVMDALQHHPWLYIKNIPAKFWRLWMGGWWNPFPYIYSPPYLGSVYVWVFAFPVLFFGLIGIASQWNRGKSKGDRNLDLGNYVSQWRATRAQIFVAIYITGVTLPFTVDARYSLPAYVGFAIWLGVGLRKVSI